MEAEAVKEATGPLLRWIATVDSQAPLTEYPDRLRAVTHDLPDAATVGRALAAANDALAARLLVLSEERLGPAPCPYVWLTLGSGGRGEETLGSDQDNAVAYRDAAAGPYFADLAERAVSGLAAAGLPRCPGGYVATRWRHPLHEWERMFRHWVDDPDPQALVEAEVLFDFRAVHGDLPTASLATIVRRGGGHRRFTIQMARAAVSFPPPLGLFGRIRTRHGTLDLKRGGIAAIVLLARLYALAAGSEARSTPDRLADAARFGTLSSDGAGRLARAYRVLTDLRWRTHSNRVHLGDLSPADRRALLGALRAIHDLQQATARNFRTDTVS